MHSVPETLRAIRTVEASFRERAIPMISHTHLPMCDLVSIADYIARLEAVVRAVDALHQDAQVVDERFFFGVNVHKDIWEALKAARSRVNLPATPDSSPSSQAPLDNSNKEARDGKEA